MANHASRNYALKAGFHFSEFGSSIEKTQADWLSLTLVAKKLNLIQLPELTARSPVNARFQLGFRAAHALIVSRGRICRSGNRP